MATSKDKFLLVFEAQENASKKIKILSKELADLGGPKLVKSQREIKKLEKSISQLDGSASKSKGIFTKFTNGIAIGNIVANVASAAFSKLGDAIAEIGKATLIAAEVEELGNVLQFVGQRAGFTQQQIKDYNKQLRDNGIAQKESNSAMLRAIQGNIDLADAVKLGRIAQDAAVIGQTNSSEAFQTLIDAVVKGRLVMLKSLGIQGTFIASYKKMAETLDKAVVDLTEAEKKQARLNLVMDGGKVIAGAYETAMGSASKKMRSFDRHAQNLQISVGKLLVPSFGLLVDELTKTTKEMTNMMGGDSPEQIKRISLEIAEFAAGILLAGKMMKNLGEIVIGIVDLAIIAPIESAITVFHAFVTALSDPFNMDAWLQAGTIMEDVFDGFGTSMDGIISDLDDMGQAAIDYNKTVAALKEEAAKPVETTADPMIALDARVKKSFAALVALQDLSEETIEEEEEVVLVTMDNMVDVASKASQIMSRTFGQLQGMTANAINGMVDSMLSGKESFGEIFKGIAQDFMSFFIKQALAMVISTFIPGLGGLLGGIFDTPVNDRMAARQGRDFMMWFTRGALAEAQGGTELAVGITGASNRIVPVASGGSGGGGMVVMNVQVSGNVLSNDFIEKSVAPTLEKLTSDGRSLLTMKDENVTGGRDVVID